MLPQIEIKEGLAEVGENVVGGYFHDLGVSGGHGREVVLVLNQDLLAEHLSRIEQRDLEPKSLFGDKNNLLK